jgi:hypothetical protein
LDALPVLPLQLIHSNATASPNTAETKMRIMETPEEGGSTRELLQRGKVSNSGSNCGETGKRFESVGGAPTIAPIER